MQNEGITLTVGGKYGFEFQRGQNDLALFTSLGSALAEIQSFELAIEGLLSALSLVSPTIQSHRKQNPERFYSQTLGSVIKVFKKYLPDSGIDKLLDTTREKRNYVVHKILREYGWPIMDDEDYVRAIKEIEGIRAYIENANIEVCRYLTDRSLLDLLVVSVDGKTGEVKCIVPPNHHKAEP
ncbi:MAG: hypothetical protein HYX95_02065 [Chloroflexi bacterium]|nr:hypothetical protein [Chloroflexota bacterium]